MTASEGQWAVAEALWLGHEARTHFLVTGYLSPTVRDEVATSWVRSTEVPDVPELLGKRRESATADADPRMVRLARRIAETGFSSGLDGAAVMLVNAAGTVMVSAGDPVAVAAALRAGLGVDCDVTETSLGPSAASLCAESGTFAHAAGPEHLRPALVGWTTAAVPLRAPGTTPPIGQLVIAECTPRLSPMVASWIRVAGAVIEAEWRVRT